MLECSHNDFTPPATGCLPSHDVVTPTLLIVAERDELRSALAQTVRLYGVRNVQTVAGAHACAAAARMIPDVIIVASDQQTEKSAGVIRDLRTDLVTRHTPIVARVAEPSQTATDALRVAGLSREEIVGKRLWDVVLPGTGRDLRTNWSTVLVVGALNGPCALRRRDGGSVAAEMYAAACILPDLHVAAIQTTS